MPRGKYRSVIAVKQDIADRLKAAPSSCWVWQGGKDKDGYGRITVNYKKRLVHRYAYEMWHEVKLPKSVVIRHSCHVRACWNVNHLSTGSQKENMADRQLAGRQAKGERNGRSKLTIQEVEVVRKLLALGSSLRRIASIFEIHYSSVMDIKRGKNWAGQCLAAKESMPDGVMQPGCLASAEREKRIKALSR